LSFTEPGRVERHYELSTNDPLNPVLLVTAVINIQPLPESVRRVENGLTSLGEEQSGFNIWPISQPRITVEKKEKLSLSIRVRKVHPQAGALEPTEGSTESVSFKMRRDPNGRDHWLDLSIGPFKEPGHYSVPLTMKVADGLNAQISLLLRINVTDSGLVVVPRTLDFGEISLTEMSGAGKIARRIGIRRALGAIRVHRVSSTLAFLKVEFQAIVAGSNYLVGVTVEPGGLTPGAYSGVIVAETDDPENARIEVPVRITFLK
jgi:hypothetical protein